MEGLITIRRLAESDVSAVVEIQDAAPEASRWSPADYQRACTGPGAPADSAPRRAFCGWVAERNAVVVGFLVARQAAGECEILNLAVGPASRRRGVASRLLEQALREAREAGARRAYLEVRESNGAALAFYEGHGFARAGRRTRYYSQPDEAALVFSRDLA